jgi:subtilisin family serine protease
VVKYSKFHLKLLDNFMSINIFSIDKKDTVKAVKRPVSYQPSVFGAEDVFTGKGVQVAIVGTGLPIYHGFNTISEFEVAIEEADTPNDELGATTAIAGLIAANGKQDLKGIAPSTKILCVKSFYKDYSSDVSTIAASILWAIVKKVDILVLPFEFDTNNQLIKDSLKKAYRNNIIILTLPTNKAKRCQEVISVDTHFKKGCFGELRGVKNISVSCSTRRKLSAYDVEGFVRMDNNIAALSLIAGLVSTLVEKSKKEGSRDARQFVMKELRNLSK